MPAWLNDPIYYHNRGNTTFRGRIQHRWATSSASTIVFTENPRVVAGHDRDLRRRGSTNIGVDGFRIDTAQHVNPEFWQKFVPAMLARARSDGIPNFHIFGEVATSDMDPAHTAVNTRVDKLPSVLDFAFTRAVIDVVATGRGNRRTCQAVPRGSAVRRRRRGGAAAADLSRQSRRRPLRHVHADMFMPKATRQRSC